MRSENRGAAAFLYFPGLHTDRQTVCKGGIEKSRNSFSQFMLPALYPLKGVRALEG